MLWAKIGRVGPVILNNYFESGSGRAEFIIGLFKYLTNAPIVILAMQKATINHVGDDCFEIIPISSFYPEFPIFLSLQFLIFELKFFTYFLKFELEFREKFSRNSENKHRRVLYLSIMLKSLKTYQVDTINISIELRVKIRVKFQV